MPMPVEFFAPYRGTGRTTRMLAEAVRLAQEGRTVYVIIASASRDCKSCDGFTPIEGLDIRFEAAIPPRFDWDRLRVPCSHPNCVWLIDHHKIEQIHQFQQMMRIVMEFTCPPTQEPHSPDHRPKTGLGGDPLVWAGLPVHLSVNIPIATPPNGGITHGESE